MLQSPPGSSYITNFQEKTEEELEIIALVRDRASSTCSVHDVAEPLASEFLAKFPAASLIRLTFLPDIRRNFALDKIRQAKCRLARVPTPTQCPAGEHNSTYTVSTNWYWPIPQQLENGMSLKIHTEERSESIVHDQIARLETPSFRSSLSGVHPTFGLHEQVAKFAEQLQSDTAESAALLSAQCLFHLADKQSPCKRLRRVSIEMRNMIPLEAPIRSPGAIARERSQREFINNIFTSCCIVLHRNQYEHSQCNLLSNQFQSGRHRALLALGSNLGNRVEMIESAVREMGDRGVTVVRTSALYETKPMYLEDQESFINGACEVRITNAVFYRR